MFTFMLCYFIHTDTLYTHLQPYIVVYTLQFAVKNGVVKTWILQLHALDQPHFITLFRFSHNFTQNHINNTHRANLYAPVWSHLVHLQFYTFMDECDLILSNHVILTRSHFVTFMLNTGAVVYIVNLGVFQCVLYRIHLIRFKFCLWG